MVGRTLSHYKMLEKLGSGGMGEVYVAEDTKLGRQVALKVLPPEMATGERLMRFEREAKAVATLDHPNIVTIYSVEESEGIHFYTMQLVKGKTLTELIQKKGLALNKLLEIAIPLADAVSAAHEQGITHRDLKPDNLMVSDEGRLKILDFGLAKLKQEYAAEVPGSELPTEHRTEEGRILGTVAYMSPEQAEGKTVDHRSDIFSIGILLYEMATGERPFQGDTKASIMSSILKDTPTSVTELRSDLPRDVAKLIRRCLAKNPEDRLQAAKDLRNELRELKQELDSGEVVEGVRAAAPRSKWLMLGIAVATAVVAGTVGYLLRPVEDTEATSAPMSGTLTRLTSQTGMELFPSLSPDGEDFVYSSSASGNSDIYRQRVGGETAFNLTEDTAASDYAPAFSPDGRQIVFRSEREGGGLFVMGATGESVRRLTDSGYNPAWSPDGEEILCATESVRDPGVRYSTSQLWAVNVASAKKRLITEGDAVQPNWSPHGSRIAYWALLESSGQRDVWTLPADGGVAVPVTNDAYTDWNPVWSPEGNYLYFSSDRGGSMNLWRVPIQEESGEVLGEPEPVTTGASASCQHLSLSRDGRRISYVEEVVTRNLHKVAFDPSTRTVAGPPVPITEGSRISAEPDLSPDGKWLAFSSLRGRQEDIFIIRTDGTGRRQLTNDLHKDRTPHWSPDGSRIAIQSDRGGSYKIWTIHPDGSGLQQLKEASGEELWHLVWSPDGSRMAYFSGAARTTYIGQLGKSSEEQIPEALPPLSEADEAFLVISWSPDGKWLAGGGITDAGTSTGVAIYNLESKQYRRLTDYGYGGEWLPDSRKLLFLNSKREIFLVDIQSEDVHEVLSLSPDSLGMPELSSDGHWMYFDRSTYEADIWMLTLNEEQK